MKKLFFIFLLVFVCNCSSTLQLKLGDQMAYEWRGFGAESPQEVANAALTLAYAEAIKKDPRILRIFFNPLGWHYGGATDPCYYYYPYCAEAMEAAKE